MENHPEIKYGKTGVLIINLGTPDSTKWLDVRRYLKEFLSDRRVIEVNPIIWQVILNLFILNFRPSRSAKAYKEIWMKEENISDYIYEPTSNLVNHTRELGVPVICFPRGIDNYKNFCEVVKPDMVNIDYNVDPEKAVKEIKIPIQGGLDPKVLLTDKENLHTKVIKYLQIFKDHPYVFNLGHGILPETKIEMVEELVKIVRDFK